MNRFMYLTIRHLTIGRLSLGCLLITCAFSTALASPGLDRLQAIHFPLTENSELARFAPGLTIGTTLYGSANVDEMPDPVQQQLREAYERGMRGFTFYLDWFALEPEPGSYDFSDLIANLDALEEFGFNPVINLTLIDVEDFTLPADLLSDGQLAPGLRLNGATLRNRLAALLDQLVPLLDQYGVWFLGFGNEMDALFEIQPELLADYVELIEFATEYTQALAPELTTGVIVTGTAVLELRPTWRALREAGILVGMNYAPVDGSDFTVIPADQILDNIQMALNQFEGEPVLIQELTCPNAISMGGSREWQRQCMEILLGEIQTRPEVRLASIFTLVDFEDELCRMIQSLFLGDEDSGLPPDLYERIAEYLCTMGVLEGSGAVKPAWVMILNQLPEIVAANRLNILRQRIAPTSRLEQ